jgi:aspartate dehydrogenase
MNVSYNLEFQKEAFFSVKEDVLTMIVGLLGCGAMAKLITKCVVEGDICADLKFFYDRNLEKAGKLASQLNGTVVTDINDMLDGIDLVVEAASPQAVREIVPQVLENGKDVILMSVEALLNSDLRKKLKKIARKNNSKIYVPSGEIAGLDGVKAASIGKIYQVNLITRKPPKSLGISAKTETIVYEGKTKDTTRKFPTNMDTAATLSITCDKEVDVKIIADPHVDHTSHEVHMVGDFGELKTITYNKECPVNPKTTVLAAYSVIKLLKSLNTY